MPRSDNDKHPLYYVADGDWPEVTLTHDAPLSAYCGLLLASDLNRTMRSRKLSLRGLADVACVAHSTVARVLNGDVLPDIGTRNDLSSTSATERTNRTSVTRRPRRTPTSPAQKPADEALRNAPPPVLHTSAPPQSATLFTSAVRSRQMSARETVASTSAPPLTSGLVCLG
ncbi:hypothetical protein GCM10010307_09360 [Streptomyces vastus]|uniref:XRE family transcriptional regulator n=1 Tax=Streptomyces vastus TaxID=285451 RepID=A0ABN3QED6_9ACTN